MSRLWDDPSPSSFCTFWQRVYCVALPVVLLVVPAFWLLHNEVHTGKLLNPAAFISRVVLLLVLWPRPSYSSISFYILYLLTKWWCTTRVHYSRCDFFALSTTSVYILPVNFVLVLLPTLLLSTMLSVACSCIDDCFVEDRLALSVRPLHSNLNYRGRSPRSRSGPRAHKLLMKVLILFDVNCFVNFRCAVCEGS